MGNTDRQAQFSAATDRQDPPLWEIKLRPHRSLSNRGFAFVILLTAGALSIPMFAFLGTLAVWGLLPYAALAVFMLWTAIRASDRDGTLTEHLQLWPDLIAVHRMNPRKPDQYWCANPYWVTAHIQQTRDTKDYLTLKGAGREIEL
ncbi:MAG: DUF2244 domain-containing protein, partial [Pseudomonadota bacterium]